MQLYPYGKNGRQRVKCSFKWLYSCCGWVQTVAGSESSWDDVVVYSTLCWLHAWPNEQHSVSSVGRQHQDQTSADSRQVECCWYYVAQAAGRGCHWLFQLTTSLLSADGPFQSPPPISGTVTHLTSAPSLMVFRQRLKTFLFRRSYPHLIIWH